MDEYTDGQTDFFSRAEYQLNTEGMVKTENYNLTVTDVFNPDETLFQ